MIAVTVSDIAVVGTFLLFAIGLGCLLSDAWRHDRDLKRKAEGKRPMNRARLERLHVVDRASYVVDGRFPGRQFDHAPAHLAVGREPATIDIYDQGGEQ